MRCVAVMALMAVLGGEALANVSQSPLPPIRPGAAEVESDTAPANAPSEPTDDRAAPDGTATDDALTEDPASESAETNLPICRDPRLEGERLDPFLGDIAGCGIFDAVRLGAVLGVRLDTPATLDCRTALRLADWLGGVAAPRIEDALGSPVVEMKIYGSYACRTRNNRPGGRLSEHAVGRAVDVAGFALADGRTVTVSGDWASPEAGPVLKTIAEAACGPFTTVLGPDADVYHQDHLHLDTAYRQAPYCR